MRTTLAIFAATSLTALSALPGPYSPAPGQAGSDAVAYNDALIIGWATGSQNFVPGYRDISRPEGVRDDPDDPMEPLKPFVSWGTPEAAEGPSDVHEVGVIDGVFSLGDGGRVTMTFAQPFGNGPGPDFAVFENGFDDDFLELAFVEVSSDGTTFYRFPSVSLTQTDEQIGSYVDVLRIDARDIYNLAGKYRNSWGTPFELEELAGNPGLNINSITHVRIVDAIGSINPTYGSLDSLGNVINDPWPTPFATGGFDLDAVAVMNVPEPSSAVLMVLGATLLSRRRRG